MAEILRQIKDRLAFLWLRLSAALTLLVVLALALAVLGYAPQDSSLNASGGAAVTNWLGRPGAIAADMMLQLFGLAGWLILLPLGARAARQLSGTVLSLPNWRFSAALIDCACPHTLLSQLLSVLSLVSIMSFSHVVCAGA